MKKTVTVGLGGRNLIIDEDACTLLGMYIDSYSSTLVSNQKEVMEEVEARFADLLREALGHTEVVTSSMVEAVAAQMGLTRPVKPEQPKEQAEAETPETQPQSEKVLHKFFRDTDDRKIGGVCSGLALYFDIDVVLVRVIFLAALICATAGFWIYIIVCIAAPSAYTAAEKCQLRGIPCTAENIRKFVDTKK